MEVVQTSTHDSCHHCKRLIRKALERLEQVVVGFKELRSRIMKEVFEVVRLFPQECSQQRTEGTAYPGADRASGQSDSTIVWRS